jgi:hypothetical protein
MARADEVPNMNDALRTRFEALSLILEIVAGDHGGDARDACTWSQEDECSGSWNTSCGHMFRLDEGSPEDNGMKFCCYCGETLTSERWVDEDAAITGAPGHE